MKKWTLADMTDQSGKVVLVTGGNSGLGFESVKAFALRGAEVLLACRSVEKGEAAKADILRQSASAKVEVMALDLMSLKSVKDFAERFKQKYAQLDLLLNNAGIMMPPYQLTNDGFESQMGTNHLGHFALTGLLLDVIVKTPNARVVTTSSVAHKQGKMDFNNLLFANGKGYSPMKAYGRSKLSNLLFTYQLQHLFQKHGIKALALAAHPGVSHTNLGRHLESSFLYPILFPIVRMVTQAPSQGALPQLRAAVEPNLRGGEYFGPSGWFQVAGSPVRVNSNKASHSTMDAQKLWAESEKLTGVSYHF